MTPIETIKKIGEAIANGTLADAEKALEEYVLDAWCWHFDSAWSSMPDKNNRYFNLSTEERKTLPEIYQEFINQK